MQKWSLSGDFFEWRILTKSFFGQFQILGVLGFWGVSWTINDEAKVE